MAARKSTEVQGGRVRPFLYATAIRVAANARRSLPRRPEVPSEAVGEARSREPLPEDELLAKLPAELRRVLVLAEIEQLTMQQIAELELIPPGTVASRLRRARALFHGYLEAEQQRNPFDRRRP